jgi:hypothetical protein
MPGVPDDRICGVERDIIEAFLVLVRDKYAAVDKANYFLEINVGSSGINVAITNQRDVISHLVTLLTRPDMSREQKLEQIGNAEEHLRRAVLESYEKGVAITAQNVLSLFAKYRETVLTLAPSPEISSRPNLGVINARLREIQNLREKGRAMKARNKWDCEWEQGVENFVVAFTKLKELEELLEDYISRAVQIRDRRYMSLLTWWGIVATVLLGVASLVVAYLATN